jgi:hypothetical protein
MLTLLKIGNHHEMKKLVFNFVKIFMVGSKEKLLIVIVLFSIDDHQANMKKYLLIGNENILNPLF